MLEGLGFKNLPDFSRMAAITFCDLVVSHEPFTGPLLLHELVHVEQYRQLGVERFAELYVNGFLSGGSYEEIRLEINAYGLEGTSGMPVIDAFPSRKKSRRGFVRNGSRINE